MMKDLQRSGRLSTSETEPNIDNRKNHAKSIESQLLTVFFDYREEERLLISMSISYPN